MRGDLPAGNSFAFLVELIHRSDGLCRSMVAKIVDTLFKTGFVPVRSA